MRVSGWGGLVVSCVLAGAILALSYAPESRVNAQPAAVQSTALPAPDSGQAAPESSPVAQQQQPAPAAPVAKPAPATPVAPVAAAPSRTPATPSGPSIVVVMESSGGLRAASELRTSLQQVGYRVLSSAESQRKSTPPDVLLTVAFTPPTTANGARSVHVAYWSRDGQTDSLTAASLSTLDQLNAVALALSSALIDRHRNDDVSSVTDSARARLLAEGRVPGVLYAMVSALPRTNVRLRVEDF